MPLIEKSSYRAPAKFLNNAHIQTILPSVLKKEPDIAYEREEIATPDDDRLILDWARGPVHTSELMLVSHGLCGNTHRHYCLSVVHAFRKCGIDCLAWNYQGTGRTLSRYQRVTCNNSTAELSWVIQHAIRSGYRAIYLVGFSMGGNLTLLYLGREAQSIPPEVKGGVAICGTIDAPACTKLLSSTLGGFYEWHFMRKLRHCAKAVVKQFPELDTKELRAAKSIPEFDNCFTAPISGFRDADEYYRQSSACRWVEQVALPTLLVNPTNDPFLTGGCFPVEAAQKSRYLYLETPDDGGHCGFISRRGEEWWPAKRAREFVLNTIRPAFNLPELTATL